VIDNMNKACDEACADVCHADFELRLMFDQALIIGDAQFDEMLV